jgi:crotonobetainyl-CoA:carnitine CoA-transferase CaiB-like acyl-CoA transferase
VQIGDLAGGAMQAVIGILAALEGRHHTGQGRFVDISMTDGVVGWLSPVAAMYFAAGYRASRGSYSLNGGLPEYSVYETQDGKYLSVGALEPKFFSRLCQLIGLENYAEVGTRGERATEIRAALTARFKEKTRDEWLEILANEDTCVGPVYEIDEIFEDPQIQARGLVVEMEHPKAGRVKQVGLPVKFDGLTEKDIVRRPSPGFGEHTAEVLATLGYSPDDIERLKKEGVI